MDLETIREHYIEYMASGYHNRETIEAAKQEAAKEFDAALKAHDKNTINGYILRNVPQRWDPE